MRFSGVWCNIAAARNTTVEDESMRYVYAAIIALIGALFMVSCKGGCPTCD